MARNSTIKVNETVNLIDTYTGECLCRSAEISSSDFPEIEKLIEKTTGLKVLKSIPPTFEYEFDGERVKLSLLENCITGPYLEIVAKSYNPNDCQKTYQTMNILIDAVKTSLKEMGKTR